MSERERENDEREKKEKDKSEGEMGASGRERGGKRGKTKYKGKTAKVYKTKERKSKCAQKRREDMLTEFVHFERLFNLIGPFIDESSQGL